MRLCVRQITQQYCGRRLYKGEFGGENITGKTITMTVLLGEKGNSSRDTQGIELTGLSH